MRGGGELVERLGDCEPFGILVLPSHAALSTAAVYREADRLGLPRSAEELGTLDPLAMVGVNDLEQAAISLEPSIEHALERARDAGAQTAMVCGSGPTVIGLFDDPAEAERAANQLASAGVEAIAARSFAAIASRLSDNSRPVSRLDITYLVAGVCGVIGIGAFVGLILVPAVGSYTRAWERFVATALSLYVLAAMIGLGLVAAAGVVWVWGRYG